jgi:hypothetical protein
MSDKIVIGKLLVQLKSDNPHTRDIAAAELTDLIEADYLNKREFKQVVQTLLQSALTETDWSAQESMFNALSSASEAPAAETVNWDPIASSLDRLNPACLEHAFVILGFSGNPKYRTKIKHYLTHPDETIRLQASEALEELNLVNKLKRKPRNHAEKTGKT